MNRIINDICGIFQDLRPDWLPISSILLHGSRGTGKTTMAANIAMMSGFPFIKIISADDLIGKSEFYKTNFIIKTFDDAYKSS